MFPFSSFLRHHHIRRTLTNHHHHYHYRHKLFSTSTAPSPTPLELPLCHPTYLIWGSNTSVGKTLVSAGVAASYLLHSPSPAKFLYLKPVQTGFPADSDSRFLFRKLSALFQLRRNPPFALSASNSVHRASLPAAKAVLGLQFEQKEAEICGSGMFDLGSFKEEMTTGKECVGRPASKLVCETMYAWRDAVSPHLAAEKEGGAVQDSVVLELLQRCLKNGMEDGSEEEQMCVVETAGGVASPGPSGSLQCDLYR